MSRYAEAVREELWSRGRLVESRVSYGEAIAEGDNIIATDARDDALVSAAKRELERLREGIPAGPFTVRLVAEANTEGTSATMVVRSGALSIVTTPEHIRKDIELLFRTSEPPPPARQLVWRNGTAAVLLHEAAGHPLEHGLPPLVLPEWLDADIPLSMRRASFRDVPLLRMQHVRVAQTNAPFALPDERIEIELVDGGAYEPLTDTVTIRVAVPAFELVVPRGDIVFAGAEGEPVRYPGVVCSREGQELVVESYAPTLITTFR